MRSRPASAINLPKLQANAPVVTAIVVSHNSRETIESAVRSALRSAGPHTIQVIVVDNESTDGTADFVQETFPEVTLIRSENIGFAGGNNVGLELAKGRYILLLNPDAELCGRGLEECIDYMNLNDDIGILGCRVIHSNDGDHPNVFRCPTLRKLAYAILVSDTRMRRSPRFTDPYYAQLEPDRPSDVDVVVGCFMLARRSAVAQVGGMDERFFLYSEESEWCHRMREGGWRVCYFPGATVRHVGGASTSADPLAAAVELTKSQILFLSFTRGPVAARTGAFLMLLATFVRLFAPREQRQLSSAALRARLAFLAKAVLFLPRGRTSTRGPHPPLAHRGV